MNRVLLLRVFLTQLNGEFEYDRLKTDPLERFHACDC